MTEEQLKHRNAKIKAGIQKRLEMKSALRREIMASIEGSVEEKIQRVRNEAHEKAYAQGVKDATRSMRDNSFHDLALAWQEVQRGLQSAANFAGIVSSMYRARVKNEKGDHNEQQ